MSEFLHGGRAVDLVLAVVGAEVLLLLAMHRITGRGFAPLDLLGQLLAGALLLAALRCALTGADDRWTVVCLAASGPAHLFDLIRRWRARSPPPGRPAEPGTGPAPRSRAVS